MWPKDLIVRGKFIKLFCFDCATWPEPVTPAVEAWSLSQWTIKEVPKYGDFKTQLSGHVSLVGYSLNGKKKKRFAFAP